MGLSDFLKSIMMSRPQGQPGTRAYGASGLNSPLATRPLPMDSVSFQSPLAEAIRRKRQMAQPTSPPSMPADESFMEQMPSNEVGSSLDAALGPFYFDRSSLSPSPTPQLPSSRPSAPAGARPKRSLPRVPSAAPGLPAPPEMLQEGQTPDEGEPFPIEQLIGQEPELGDSVPNEIEVVPGDSLWKLAKKLYGDGTYWRRIYEANKDVIGSDPNIIRPGTRLRVQ